MDKKLKQLREAYSLLEKTVPPEEERSDSFCYMLYLTEEDEAPFINMQKEFALGGDLTKPGKFHTTVRYVKDNDYKPLVEHLKGQELTTVKGKCNGFALYGKNKEALVIELEGDELHDHFNKYNDWLVSQGFPESDYPDYKPHITLTEEEGIQIPEWKPEYEKEITFHIHIVTNRGYEEVFREEV